MRAAIVVALVAARVVGAAAPGGMERIAFRWSFPVGTPGCPQCRQRRASIFSMNPDGTDLRQLTAALGRDSGPQWSPDGSRIVFESDRGSLSLDPKRGYESTQGDHDSVWVMNADGSDLKPLVPPADDCRDNEPCDPVWSPDGAHVVFASHRGSKDSPWLYRVNADGSGLVALAPVENKFGSGDVRPAFSPDGRRIAFIHTEDKKNSAYNFDEHTYDVWVMNADGSQRRALELNKDFPKGRLAWSADGRRVQLCNSWGALEGDADGGGWNLVTSRKCAEGDRSPSPDGSRYTYSTGRVICVKNADGSHDVKITRPMFRRGGVGSLLHTLAEFGDWMTYSGQVGDPDSDAADQPVWASVRDAEALRADHGRIAFAAAPRAPEDPDVDVYSMSPVGGEVLRLTKEKGADEGPAFSPDGGHIAFVSSRDGNPEIYLMNPDGSTPRRLTRDPARDADPAWSPDGSSLAFGSDREGKGRIFVMSAEGKEVRRVSVGPGDDSAPAWSPDGKRLAFVSDREGKPQIFVTALDGTGLKRLSDGHGSDRDPAWSPDGARLAFASERGADADIYVMQADGSHVVRVTESPGLDRRPAWSPDGRRISFVTARYDASGQALTIATMGVEAGVTMRLTSGLLSDHPTWSAKGDAPRPDPGAKR
jgi:Tol biopolymer transport system component